MIQEDMGWLLTQLHHVVPRFLLEAQPMASSRGGQADHG